MIKKNFTLHFFKTSQYYQLNFSRAVCREETKEGVCPKLSRDRFRSEMSCSDECSSDSDCSGDNKCCYNGCSYSCLKAVKDPGGLDEETKDDQVPIGNAMLMGGS